MRHRLAHVFAATLVALGLAACGAAGDAPRDETDVASGEAPAEATAPEEESPPAKTYAVARVIDGDTVELRNGRRVRLVQIDAPEARDGECYGIEASAVLSAILPKGTKITLEPDPELDKVDQYDRLLRYVFKGTKNVNLALVRRGAAGPWFYRGEKGRYARPLLKAAKRARADGRGLWAACPAAVLDPSRALQTGPASAE